MNFHDHIDDYILNRLDNAQKEAFENALNNDVELQTELEFRRKIKSGYQELETADLKEQVKSAIGQASAKAKEGTPHKFKYWWILMLPILFGLGYIIGQNLKGDSSSPKEIYAEFYNPKLRFDRTRSTAKHQSMEEVLYEMYQSKDYDGLYYEVSKLSDQRTTKDLRFVKAIAANDAGKTEESLQILETFISVKDPMYYDQAIWSKAMILLKLDKIDEAKTILTELVNTDSKLAERAKTVLDKL